MKGNTNGRICLLYSFYWGVIAIYLMKSLNPNIDRMINFLKSKIDIKFSKVLTIVIIIFLLIDCLVSAFAIELFLAKTVVEKQLPAQNRSRYVTIYEKYFENEQSKKKYRKYVE